MVAVAQSQRYGWKSLLLACLLTVCCNSVTAAGGTLKIIPHADLKNTDPIWTTAYITRNHGYMIYDTLFSLDADLQPQPQMVDTWTVSDDGLIYTFTLRDGLRWHDDAPVRAADCVASIRRWGKRDGMGQKLLDVTASLEAVDDKTFKLQLKEPYGLVLHSIGKISSNVPFMMPKRFADTDAFEQVKEIVGSGPFKFVKDEWLPGAKVIYVKNDAYVPRDEPASGAAGGKLANVDRVEWHYIPDAATNMNALIAGEIDFWENVPPDFLPMLRADGNIKVESLDPLGNQGWLRPNHLNPPFDNAKARQALLYMVKQKTYLQAIVGDPNLYRECAAYFICGTPLESDAGTEPLVTQDFEKARALLKEGGYNGETLILMDSTDIPQLHAAALVTAQLLRKIGAKVEVQAMDWSTLTSRRAEKKSIADGGWNIFHTWSIGADVSSPVSNIGISGGCVERAWFGWPCDEKLEELRDDYAKESDPMKQKEIGIALQIRAFEVVPYVNFGQWFNPVAYRTNVKGVIPSPVQFFWNISVE
jgi:peptide/nickel transport system substrate-binding protein